MLISLIATNSRGKGGGGGAVKIISDLNAV